MITEALLHCAGVGPAKLAKLHASGIRSWSDVLERPEQIPAGLRPSLVDSCQKAFTALHQNDIRFFVQQLAAQDKWRILSQYCHEATYFDIETTGLEYDATISVIVCWHRGQLHSFVEHENLDDFLDLLDDVRLLVSFNGSSFDVPRVLDGFHIPDLPCPHLDVRWSCYHRGLTGSLKTITDRLGFRRPADLRLADGEMAVQLWNDWLRRRNQTARSLLLRYCGADVLLLKMLSHHLAAAPIPSAEDLWSALHRTEGGTPGESERTAGLQKRTQQSLESPRNSATVTGVSSQSGLSRLRALRGRRRP